MSAPRAPRAGASPSLSLAALILTLCVAIPALGAGGNAERILEVEPQQLVERLDAQKLLVLEEAGKNPDSFVIAYVIFERSVDDVIGLIRQASRQLEYRPELDGVETIRRFEGGRIDEQRIRILFTTFVYRVRYRDLTESEQRIEWELDADYDNDMAVFEGFWEFYPYEVDPNRTLARFGSQVNVGPAVPRFIQKRMSRKTVLRYLENCRLWIDSDGEWRP
jgi:hypothetical protein